VNRKSIYTAFPFCADIKTSVRRTRSRHHRWRSQGFGESSPTSICGRYQNGASRKIRELVQVCIACR